MKEFTYTITHPHGIHGRPAAALVTAAKALDGAVTVCKGDRQADACRMMALMTLGAAQGDTVTVRLEGGDEEGALRAMEEFFAQNL